MSYKIAVASSDEQTVDLHFGSANIFLIYEVKGREYALVEHRKIIDYGNRTDSDNSRDCANRKDCGNSKGCSNEGCGGSETIIKKIESISDCRCIVCKKIGFQVQKQLERKAISSFDVECTIEEALGKIVFYYDRIDKHETLRKFKEVEEEHEKISEADN